MFFFCFFFFTKCEIWNSNLWFRVHSKKSFIHKHWKYYTNFEWEYKSGGWKCYTDKIKMHEEIHSLYYFFFLLFFVALCVRCYSATINEPLHQYKWKESILKLHLLISVRWGKKFIRISDEARYTILMVSKYLKRSCMQRWSRLGYTMHRHTHTHTHTFAYAFCHDLGFDIHIHFCNWETVGMKSS